MNRMYVPKNMYLYSAVTRLHQCIHENNLVVQFVHVPRESNKLADYMGRLAAELNRAVTLNDCSEEML